MEGAICFSIEIDKNINHLSDYFGAMISAKDNTEWEKLFALHPLQKGKRSSLFKRPTEDCRLFSNYFTNVIIGEKGDRYIKPMRYRVRPRGSTAEVPAKYNVFNARLDSLEIRPTWKPLFMHNHGLVPFTRFFEWVAGPDGRPKLISFKPENRDMMWAPCLWDEWISPDGSLRFKSFAIITDEPPPEIVQMGHDRCPLFLAQEYIDQWLNPEGKSKKEMYAVLRQKEKVTYTHQWVV